MEVASPKIITHKMKLISVTKNTMKLRLWRYGFIILRGKGKKKKKPSVIYVGKIGDDGETTSLGKLKLEDASLDPITIAEDLAKLSDEYITQNALQIAEALITYINNWDELLVRKELDELLRKPLEDEIDTASKVDVESLKGVEFEKVLTLVSKLLSPSIAELLEIVMSVGLTLRQVDRSKGIVDNRPVWLTIVADPSTYKTTTLRLLSESKHVVFAQNFTPASLLPANMEVTPLIELMNNRVFIIPTLSEETADKDTSRKIFSALESVYDGEYAKSTGLSGFRKEYVDTVIISAVTPAVWEDVLPYIANIGYRWLVYRYRLSDEEALQIQQNLENMKEIPSLRKHVSTYFDFLMDNINYAQLKEVIIPDNYKEDLENLAKLVARLRVVPKYVRSKIKDEETEAILEKVEIEVVQVEAPSRAYQQLKNFVRANTLLRKSSVKKIVGLPVVDEHAMRLASKLAIGSTKNNLKDVLLHLAEKQARNEEISFRTLSRATGLPLTTTYNLITILKHPRIDLIDDDLRVKEPFFSLIKKYLLTQSSGA